ncbi:MAG TPA: stage V sporulation protein AE [Firmicutes bacterium]|nr:stage V sporulation protein AE [Bacillota bacterium]
MTYLYSALFLGLVCLIAQLLYEYTKLTPGHITSIYVVLGVLLESFNIYDKISKYAPGGATLSILNFGHIMTHSVVEKVNEQGFIGILSGMFVPCSISLTVVIVVSIFAAIVFKPKP